MLKIIKDSTLVPTPIVDLKLDSEPRQGSTDPVTSDGVKGAIDGAVGDASAALQEQIDEIAEKAGSGYIPKGEASVATLNGLSGQENGDLYTMTDAGTLTLGSVAVVAGDTVAWDATNSVWYKAMDYAPRQYGTNEVHNLATTITAFRTGDVIPVDGPSGTAKMSKDDLLNETAENALDYSVNSDKFILSGNVSLISSLSGKKIIADGSIVDDLNYTLNVYDVSKTDVIDFVARLGESAYLVFFDVDDNIVEAIQGRSVVQPGNNFNDVINVPEDAVKFYASVCVNSVNPHCISLVSPATLMDDKFLLIDKNFPRYAGMELKCIYRNHGIDSSGNFLPSQTGKYDTAFFAVSGATYIRLIARINAGYSIVFYDIGGNIIGHYDGTSVDPDPSKPNITDRAKIQVPDGTTEIRIPFDKTATFEIFSNLGLDSNFNLVKRTYEIPEPIEHISGKAVRTNGAVEDSPTYDTNVYNVSRLTTFHVFGKIGANTCILFLDAGGNIISYVAGRTTPNVYVPNFDDDIVIPFGAVTMKIGYGNNVDFYVDNGTFKSRVENIASRLPLFGKKVAFIGSSSTYGTGATDGQNFVNVFAQMTGATVTNLGDPGTCVANNTKNGRGADRFVTRATPANIGNVDLVVVQIANNDLSYDSKAIGPHFAITTLTPSGNIGDKQLGPITDTDTFAGALHDLITTIQTNVKDGTPVVFVTPHHVDKALATNPNSLQCNSNGDFAKDFVDAIKDICSFYAVPVLDMYSMGSMSALTANYSYLFSDGLHFNNKGHYMLADLLVKFIRNNICFIES